MPSRTNKLRKNPTSEGRRAVFESLKTPESIDSILISKKLDKSELFFEINEKCKKFKIELVLSEDKEMSKLSNTGKHQGVIANLVSEGYFPEIKFWDNLDNSDKLNVLILDGIQDPHNFGSISRSALAFGIENIFIPKKRSVGITPGSIRSSAGAIHSLNIIKVVNISNLIEKLKKNNFWIYGLKGKSKNKSNIDFNKNRKALVVGSEHDGISNLVETKLDFTYEIPMKFKKIDSLNASVAASIAMFQMFEISN
ncbi:MAG: 23S rRNA (guanosine(2251)-2'-O)-methyltransferase RlmB [Chloroflexi bacterium]|nr:23S rRNA (guanosine(2251)-2'-O)-methyltransferase RlmB [Chloroflexota bacterium]|tara:strand:+ start:3613 stop:4374 length:762 start_codon:yes stop_codon:yes gene_type:complete